MEFGQARAHTAPEHTFPGLSAAERRTLAGWVAHARNAGIDGAQDLSVRAWPESAVNTNIIGIFRSGHVLASWLIVGQGGSWAVASCGNGEVSQGVASLAEALALVHMPHPVARRVGA